MTTLTEVLHSYGFVINEDDGHLSRDNKVLISGQNLAAGTVLGIIGLATPTSAAKGGGNTGNGTFVLDATTPLLANAQAGIYTFRATAAGTNTATFRVTDPKGNVLGDATFNGSGASVTFADQIKAVITDGATDFVVGDGFDVTVGLGSGKVTQLNLAAFDGSQNAACVLAAPTNAAAGDLACVVMARACELNSNEIVWPGGFTTPQKAAGAAQLATSLIVLR
jgi:Bacteriophage lambda head decoration protein D